MKSIPHLSNEDALRHLTQRSLHPWESNYLAHYSSYWDGILTDPRLLLIPVDDHLVHRGDGVFEAFRWIDRKFYLLHPHLQRLRYSAEQIGLSVPWSNEEIESILEALVKAAQKNSGTLDSGSQDLIFRLFVSRGAGSFSPNPYDCPRPHLTVVACKFNAPSEMTVQCGVKIGRSIYSQKPAPFSTIKSCNYLSNVLMKKESVERKLDFVVAFTHEGFLAESATENIFLITNDNKILHPYFSTILRGTTLVRALELAQSNLQITSNAENITESMLLNAKEVCMVGTTLDILPVASYESQTYSVGPIALDLRAQLHKDQKSLKLS